MANSYSFVTRLLFSKVSLKIVGVSIPPPTNPGIKRVNHNPRKPTDTTNPKNLSTTNHPDNTIIQTCLENLYIPNSSCMARQILITLVEGRVIQQ
jgi:hypothetical protein